MEARTARELNALAPAILSRHQGSSSDEEKIRLALAFARLGRIEAGIRAADAMDVRDADASNGTPKVRDEVRRIGVRRRALAGNIVGALELATFIQTPKLRADALFAIARAQIRVGDIASAQKTLFQAAPLVADAPVAQMYCAVLFGRAGEANAAKRLLERVEKSLPTSNGTKPPSQRTFEDEVAEGNRSYLAWAFSQTGQSEKAAQIRQDISGDTSFDTISLLIRAGRFDGAEKLARQVKNESRQLENLTTIAFGLQRTQPERAVALEQEISERLQKLPPDAEPRARSADVPSLRDVNLGILAALYRKQGKEDEGAALLQQVTQHATPGAAAYLRFYYALSPFLYARDPLFGGGDKAPLSREFIERISAEVNALLPDTTIAQFGGVFPDFLDAQIDSGAQDAARQTLTLLEDKTLSDANFRKGQKRDDSNLLNPALEIVQKWQRLGDTEHVAELLNRIWDSPVARGVKPRDRAWKFAAFGFVDAARRRLAALGVGPEKQIYQYSSFAYFEAQFKPKTFPAWIEQVRDPRTKLGVLDDFSRGLTDALLQQGSEREFFLSDEGEGYSY